MRTTDLPGSKKRVSSVKDNGIVDTAKRSVITILTVNHLKLNYRNTDERKKPIVFEGLKRYVKTGTKKVTSLSIKRNGRMRDGERRLLNTNLIT